MHLFNKCYNYQDANMLKALGCYPYFGPIESELDSKVVISGKKVIMLGSNNYLGLANHPEVKEAAREATEKYGAGCTSSRLLATLDIHLKLEEELARFLGKEGALVFSTGFQTNLGAISSLVGRHDAIFIDREVHASILDSSRLSYGKIVRFRHNDSEDLGKRLSSLSHRKGKLVVVDGVYSVSGDIANLPEVTKLCGEYEAGLMVDDAHSLGILGKGGRGTGEYFGLQEKIDIIMGTFSKAFASIGGFIAADGPVIEFVKHRGRAFIFSASMPPSATASALAALKIVEKESERRERFWINTKTMKAGLSKLGFNISNNEGSLIALFVGEDEKTFRFWKALFDEGVFTNPIVTPAVPPGGSLLRISCMATHTEDDLCMALEAFEKTGKKLGIING